MPVPHVARPTTIRCLLALFALAVLPCATALDWSELLPDPSGTDDGHEYIELLGDEDIDGCRIADEKSADTLMLVRRGTGTILILENDSAVLAAAVQQNATVYAIGNAIGNGLGNTVDSLTLSCDNETLLDTAYNTSGIDGYAAGKSLVWSAAASGWIVGLIDGTPGVITLPDDGGGDPAGNGSVERNEPVDGKKITGGRSAAGGAALPTRCNTTLSITVSKTTADPGDVLLFTVISDVYVWYEVLADNVTWLEGDTLDGPEHGLVVPSASVLRISAYSEACGRQRTSRFVKVRWTPENESSSGFPPRPSDGAVLNATPETLVKRNLSLNGTGDEKKLNDETDLEGGDNSAKRGAEDMPIVPLATGAAVDDAAASGDMRGSVLRDQNRAMVPWIAAFGIVTIIVSALVFFRAPHG
jgi:hypothetical protein